MYINIKLYVHIFYTHLHLHVYYTIRCTRAKKKRFVSGICCIVYILIRFFFLGVRFWYKHKLFYSNETILFMNKFVCQFFRYAKNYIIFITRACVSFQEFGVFSHTVDNNDDGPYGPEWVCNTQTVLYAQFNN